MWLLWLLWSVREEVGTQTVRTYAVRYMSPAPFPRLSSEIRGMRHEMRTGDQFLWPNGELTRLTPERAGVAGVAGVRQSQGGRKPRRWQCRSE